MKGVVSCTDLTLVVVTEGKTTDIEKNGSEFVVVLS